MQSFYTHNQKFSVYIANIFVSGATIIVKDEFPRFCLLLREVDVWITA